MARKVFLREVSSLAHADIAIVGLKQEIHQRRQQGSMNFISNMLTYIRNNHWDNYYDPDGEIPDVIDNEETSTFLV